MLLYTLSRQSRSGKLLGFSLALLFFFGLSQCAIWAQLPAQQKAATQQEPAKDTATADRGRKLFEQSCDSAMAPMPLEPAVPILSARRLSPMTSTETSSEK